MEKSRLSLLFTLFCVIALVTSCTEEFDEINTGTQGFTTDEVSAKFFLTSAQVELYSPGRFAYWRAQLIHSDRFAGHYTFGHNASWWSDGLSYTYNGGYTDATFGWMSGFLGRISDFSKLTDVGGDFENQYMNAVAKIIKSLYYQMYTDTFGMVPFSEAAVDGILTPKYDTQKEIYKGIIADLDAAMATIGDTERTGLGVEDVGSNDIYCGGDLQLWKRLANTLKLRIGLRALGADGDDFAAATIASALSAPLLDANTGSVTMRKDFEVSKWGAAAYGDVWNDFGGGSDWTMGATLINLLKKNDDPRLSAYAAPAVGGSFTYTNDVPEPDPDYQARLDFITGALDDAEATYTATVNGAETVIDVPAGQFIGQPSRINGDTYPYVRYNMFSTPSDAIKTPRGKEADGYPEIVLSSAESYFLQAEAAVRGLSGGDAQALFEMGIAEAMDLWNVGGADAYIAGTDLADITGGTMEEKLEKIALQRWIAGYTDGFEAWAVVRDTGYPSELAAGVTDDVIYALGTLNGAYPQRLRYGGGAQDNPRFAEVEGIQGPDLQGTKLWFAK